MCIVVFNQDGVTPAELVEKHAEELANRLGGGTDATRTQLRRFYQEYVMLRDRTRSSGYARSEVGIKMLIAKAAYARGRTNSKIPELFVEWLQANLKAIKCAGDVEVFGDYFEAMMGYFYGAQKERSGGGRR